MTTTPHFSSWLEAFFAEYYRHRPVNATFVGNHTFDSILPDFSDNAVGDLVAEMRSQLARGEALPSEPLSPIEQIDRKLADGYLRTQLWEFQSDHFYRGNPCVYTGEAVFGVIALFLGDFAPIGQRVQAATLRMQAVPHLLDQGAQNIRQAPAAWIEKAIDECVGAEEFFSGGVDQLIVEHAIAPDSMRKSADLALAAFRRFRDYLEKELSPKAVDRYAAGVDAFALMMHFGHFIDPDLNELIRYAEAEIAEADAYLSEHAADFDCSSSTHALGGLSDLHPTADKYYSAFDEAWQACRTAVEEHELVTWHDFPLEYTPQPLWARAAAPHLYFLPYRAPAAFARPAIHRYWVPPLPAGDPEKHLHAVNNSVIKMNHVIHHGSLGHHLQNWNANRAESRIGQMAATDCALRLALFCAGTMAEGWAVYATTLMDEIGYLTPLESYGERQSRRRMCARAVVDVRLHRGECTLEEAVQYYQTRGGMGRDMAYKEAVKNSMFPGAAMMYLFGSDRIRRLREQAAAKQGPHFHLRDFHDRFLSFGSIPVELIAAEMTKEFDHAE